MVGDLAKFHYFGYTNSNLRCINTGSHSKYKYNYAKTNSNTNSEDAAEIISAANTDDKTSGITHFTAGAEGETRVRGKSCVGGGGN